VGAATHTKACLLQAGIRAAARELPQFKNQLTTTEHLATYIQKEIKKEAASVFNGTLNITLGESHNAWAGVME